MTKRGEFLTRASPLEVNELLSDYFPGIGVKKLETSLLNACRQTAGRDDT